MTPWARAPRRALRDVGWLPTVLVLLGVLIAVGGLVRSSERDRRQAAMRSLTERAATSAALTDSAFRAVGGLSTAQLTQRYGGKDVARALRSDGLRGGRAVASAPVFIAITDGRGRTLAAAGPAPRRFAQPGDRSQVRLSQVAKAAGQPVIRFTIPFLAHDFTLRTMVQGLPLSRVQAFLDAFLARLPNPDGAHVTVTDGAGVVLARRLPAADDRAVAMVRSAAPVPGTPWRLRLAAPEARVYAGLDSHRWVPWALLAGLTAAALLGLALSRRLQLTARRAQRTARELAASQDELRNLISALDEGVAHRDVGGTVHLLNDSARIHMGTDVQSFDAEASPWTLLDADGRPLDAAEYPSRQASEGRTVAGMVVGLDDADGVRRWLRFSASPLTGDGTPAPYPVVMSFTDVTTERELQLHLTRLAECDPLTGLKNRRSFEDDLRTLLARRDRDGGHGALVTLDIDRFKGINDSRGHLAGDDVLRAVARTLQQHLGDGDVAGRLGGDEFALLLPDADEDQARELGRTVVRAMRAAVRAALDGLEIDVTFGVATVAAHGEQAEDVLDASDRDMYRHKPAHAGLTPPVTTHATGGRADDAPAPGPGADAPDALEERSQALSALYATVLACDGYTASHSRDVVLLARAVATELGLDPATCNEIEHVALIHDVGKIAIPDSILHKPGPLTPDEQAIMRQHPVIGAQIVGSVAGLRHLAPGVRGEHERWDGRGYPDGLSGEAIPLASRVVFVCDALHAMTTDRPYRPALTPAAAQAELERHAGTQFCPKATLALLRVLAARADEVSPVTDDRTRELTPSS